MKICKVCGTKNFDVNETCEKCKTPLGAFYKRPNSASGDPGLDENKQGSDLSLAVKIILIIGLCSLAIGFLFSAGFWLAAMSAETPDFITVIAHLIVTAILFAYLIVSLMMTLGYFNKIADGKRIGTAYKICTLLFFNPIAGILMLCDRVN